MNIVRFENGEIKKTFFARVLPKASKGQDILCFVLLSRNKALSLRTLLTTVLIISHPKLAPCEDSPLLFKKKKADLTIQCFLHKEVLQSKALGDEKSSI